MPRLFSISDSSEARRKALSTFLVFAVGLYAAYQVSEYVLADDMPGLAIVFICIAGGAFAVRILNNWRQGLYIFFAWLSFEDFARKFLGNNMAIYFAKDLLLLVVLLSFFMARRARKEPPSFRPPFRVALLIFFLFAVVEAFNPASASPLYGFMGLKLDFLYVPLMYLGYSLIDSEKELRRFFLFNCIIILLVCGLGIAQAVIGPSFLNPATIQEDIREMSTLYRVSPITGQVAYRPSSVFVSVGRFQNFILLTWIVMIGFGGYLLLRSRKGRMLAFISIGVIAGAALMSTSRGVMMWSGGSVLIILAAFLWGAPWRQREVTRVIRSVQRVILLGGLAIMALSMAFPDEVNSRLAVYSETLSPYSTASELTYRARDYPLRNFLMAFDEGNWLVGRGTGTASLGAQYVTRILHAPKMTAAVESGYGQLVVEMGVPGLLLWMILGLAVCIPAWRIVRQLRGSPWFPLAFVIFWLTFLLFFPIGYNSLSFYQDFLVNAYFWLFVGVLFRLPKLALSAQYAALESAREVPASAPAIPSGVAGARS